MTEPGGDVRSRRRSKRLVLATNLAVYTMGAMLSVSWAERAIWCLPRYVVCIKYVIYLTPNLLTSFVA